MAEKISIVSPLMSRVRRTASRWWGGIGCRVSFFMMVALILVATLVGSFFFWEEKKNVDAEIRDRALYVARELAVLASDDIVTGNRFELYKKITPPFVAHEDSPAGRTLLYLMIYNRDCELLIGSTAGEVFFNSGSYFYTLPSEGNTIRDDVPLQCNIDRPNKPVFNVKQNNVYELILPVADGDTRVGYVRVGISGQRFEQRFSAIMKRAAAGLLGILLVGLAFSQIIAHGITKPIQQLSDAAEKLSQQNWDAPLPVKGGDELSKLGHTFNQMAQTLKQREASLSRGNRDLFILHTTGLDLMESLDRDTLIIKVAARVEDLVRADTTALSVVDRSDHVITYLGVYGHKARVLREQELPIEAGGIYNWLASYGTPLLISDAQSDFRLDGDLMRSLGVRTIMAVPLWSSNTMIGLLTAVNKNGGTFFDKHDLRLFTVFSNLVSAALQNASLYNDLKKKIEELNSTQEQLVRSTKMAAIGELSANVAHEINNPLTSVLGYTTHLLKTLDLPDPSRKILGMMEQETLRVRKIIRNLLDFARQRPAWMRPDDVSVPLRETVALFQGIAREASVVIQEEYQPGPLLVNMDQNEIKQVFINIVNNALQAMQEGGELSIRLYEEDENNIVIEFQDTGTGIEPKYLGRIFEPFFSTKNNGDGTGLGLSISYRIVQHHGGRIETKSIPGTGTTFKVVLPRYGQASPAEQKL